MARPGELSWVMFWCLEHFCFSLTTLKKFFIVHGLRLDEIRQHLLVAPALGSVLLSPPGKRPDWLVIHVLNCVFASANLGCF